MKGPFVGCAACRLSRRRVSHDLFLLSMAMRPFYEAG